MAVRSVKVAVTIPKELFLAVEQIRKKMHVSRSALIGSTIQSWIKLKKRQEEIRQYVEGYRKFPEDPAEIEAWQTAGLQAWTPGEDWT